MLGVFQASRPSSRGPPGASAKKCARTAKASNWPRLKFHAGWSGWTRPPAMAGGGGGSAS